MKYYVTFQRIQKVTYSVEADTKKEAIELGAFKASEEAIAYDISDPEYKFLTCFSHMDVLLYNREEKNN